MKSASSNGLNRRNFLLSGVTVSLAAFLSGCSDNADFPLSAADGSGTGNGTSPLRDFPQPEIRTSGDSGLLDTTLVVKFASSVLQKNGTDFRVFTRTHEGHIGGPTLRVRPGDTLRLLLDNQMDSYDAGPLMVSGEVNIPHDFNTTNNHTHGLHVSPSGNSDNIFIEIAPGQQFQYEYHIPADHPSGTFFYHPHKHGSVSMQMFGGMGGALIVEGEIDQLPEIAAARDLVYLIQELNIDPATGLVPDFIPVASSAGSDAHSQLEAIFPMTNRILTVNGHVTPTLQAYSGEVIRIRVINSTVQTNVPFFVDGHTLNLIALDGITLPQLRTVTVGYNLAASMRTDVLVQTGQPGTYAIKKLALPDGSDPEVILGYLEVLSQTVLMSLPSSLPVPSSQPDILASEITGQRTITFRDSSTGGPAPGLPNFTMDDRRYDPNRIDQTVSLGTAEEWMIINDSDMEHPFHIHVNPFQLIAINGMPLPKPEWHDTYHVMKKMNNVPGSITIRHRFRDFTGKFVDHCHIAVHEDLGMMQTVEVV